MGFQFTYKPCLQINKQSVYSTLNTVVCVKQQARKEGGGRRGVEGGGMERGGEGRGGGREVGERGREGEGERGGEAGR